MLFINRTLPSIAENLALDEALLEEAEQGNWQRETLRLWNATETFVVVGRSSRVDVEVDRDAVLESNVPVFRRSSGGASVVAGPGCLFYALLLSLAQRPQLRMLDAAHRFVMSNMVEALKPCRPDITSDGTCDLVVEQKKVGGNSLRVRRDWMLYHGTLLLNMELEPVSRFLLHPPREPPYRLGRPHGQFLRNLEISSEEVELALTRHWKASRVDVDLPQERIGRLAGEKYASASWNFQR